MSRGGVALRVSPTLSEFLRYYRFRRNLKVRQMAKLIRLPHTTYHELERGTRTRISVESATKLVNWLITRGGRVE